MFWGPEGMSKDSGSDMRNWRFLWMFWGPEGMSKDSGSDMRNWRFCECSEDLRIYQRILGVIWGIEDSVNVLRTWGYVKGFWEWYEELKILWMFWGPEGMSKDSGSDMRNWRFCECSEDLRVCQRILGVIWGIEDSVNVLRTWGYVKGFWEWYEELKILWMFWGPEGMSKDSGSDMRNWRFCECSEDSGFLWMIGGFDYSVSDLRIEDSVQIWGLLRMTVCSLVLPCILISHSVTRRILWSALEVKWNSLWRPKRKESAAWTEEAACVEVCVPAWRNKSARSPKWKILSLSLWVLPKVAHF